MQSFDKFNTVRWIFNTGKLYDRLVNKRVEADITASPAAEVDEFDFIRNVTKRDDVDLVVSKR
jgi:hypothetical protein